MTIGVSLFTIAIGAILRFAVTTSLAGMDIHTVGVILIVVGIVGLLLGAGLLVANGGSPDRSVEP
jgi:hypothetical protein